MKRQIVTIGDIHGRVSWKEIVHQYPNADLYIFIGDYVDSFTVDNVTMIHNLKEIIDFKRQNPDRVILLWGNHDIQYFIDGYNCPGHRMEMKHDFYQEFYYNRDLFKVVHKEGNILWSHAGITNTYLNKTKRILQDPEYRFYDETKDMDIDELFNFAMDVQYQDLYKGYGPLWVRPKTLNNDPIEYHTQIVGHTATKDGKIEEVIINDIKHIYVDVLDKNTEGYVLEI